MTTALLRLAGKADIENAGQTKPANGLEAKGMAHTRGASMQPQTQGKSLNGICKQMPIGKLKRWHQTLKNRVPPENHFLPSDLEQKIADFISRDNYVRYPLAVKRNRLR